MQALDTFYRTNRQKLINQFKGRTGSYHNAEDVVQEAFLRAVQYWDTYHEGEDIASWFSGIIKNTARTFNKNERVRGMVVEENEENFRSFTPTPEFLMMVDEIRQDIRHGNRSLKKKNILYMYLIQQFSPRKISDLTDESPGNIRVIVSRYKTELKERYGESIYW